MDYLKYTDSDKFHSVLQHNLADKYNCKNQFVVYNYHLYKDLDYNNLFEIDNFDLHIPFFIIIFQMFYLLFNEIFYLYYIALASIRTRSRYTITIW